MSQGASADDVCEMLESLAALPPAPPLSEVKAEPEGELAPPQPGHAADEVATSSALAEQAHNPDPGLASEDDRLFEDLFSDAAEAEASAAAPTPRAPTTAPSTTARPTTSAGMSDASGARDEEPPTSHLS